MKMDFSEDTISYLESKGALEILSHIGSKGACRHFDLRHTVIVSSSTVTNRLNEGVKLGLLEQTIVHVDEKNTEKGYELTEKGEQIYSVTKSQDLLQKYQERKELEEIIARREDNIIMVIR